MVSCPNVFLRERHRRTIETEIQLLNDCDIVLHKVYAGDMSRCVRDHCECKWGDIGISNIKKMWDLTRVARRARGYKYWHLELWSYNA